VDVAHALDAAGFEYFTHRHPVVVGGILFDALPCLVAALDGVQSDFRGHVDLRSFDNSLMNSTEIPPD
jgi:hypothetical protein